MSKKFTSVPAPVRMEVTEAPGVEEAEPVHPEPTVPENQGVEPTDGAPMDEDVAAEPSSFLPLEPVAEQPRR